MTSPTVMRGVPAASGAAFRSKIKAGLLALWLGWAGAHWWYLGRARAWQVSLACALLLAATAWFPVWYDNPAFFLLLVPALDGFIEAAVLCLMPDEKFDARYNRGHSRRSRTGWGEVLVAIGSVLIGSIVTMGVIAMIVVYVSVASGWLDGLTL